MANNTAAIREAFRAIDVSGDGYIKEDDLKDAVLNKVAGRVGMDGPAFDKWLQMPAVQ